MFTLEKNINRDILIKLSVFFFKLYSKCGTTKSEEFSEKFQTAFDPSPLSFLENYIAIFFIMDMVAYMQGGMRAR